MLCDFEKPSISHYYNASCHLFDIAPLRGAVDLNIPFSIDISPLRGGKVSKNPS